QLETDVDLVHSDTDGGDAAVITQPAQRLEPTAGHQLLELAGLLVAMSLSADVVDEQDVDAREAEPLQTLLVRAEDSVMRIIERGLERHRRQKSMTVGARLGVRGGSQQPSGLGRNDDVGVAANGVAQAAFAETKAVIWRSVEIADPEIDRSIDRFAGSSIRNLA